MLNSQFGETSTGPSTDLCIFGPSSDIRLRTNDMPCPIDVLAHKHVLSHASPFFRDMFTLYENSHEPLQVYENAWVLVTVMRFIYPDEGEEPQLSPHAVGEGEDIKDVGDRSAVSPLEVDVCNLGIHGASTVTTSFDLTSTLTIPSLSALVPLLAAAQKWLLPRPLKALRAMLIHPYFLATEPLRVFAIATRFEFDEETKLASEWILRMGALGFGNEKGLCLDDLEVEGEGIEIDEGIETSGKEAVPEELKWVSAHAFWTLQRLHRKRSKAACDLLRWPQHLSSSITTVASAASPGFDALRSPLVPPTCMQCSARDFRSLAMYGPPRWWEEWRSRSLIELRKRPVSRESGIFDMRFLWVCVKRSGCVRCYESALGSWGYLEGVRARIDALEDKLVS